MRLQDNFSQFKIYVTAILVYIPTYYHFYYFGNKGKEREVYVGTYVCMYILRKLTYIVAKTVGN